MCDIAHRFGAHPFRYATLTDPVDTFLEPTIIELTQFHALRRLTRSIAPRHLDAWLEAILCWQPQRGDIGQKRDRRAQDLPRRCLEIERAQGGTGFGEKGRALIGALRCCARGALV